ncbi:MAG TPA: hypothetical protein VN253_17845, partial [Kofleriaceae bacterium]|nr:hypothetical protein [Kofleriaceae bacterium]
GGAAGAGTGAARPSRCDRIDDATLANLTPPDLRSQLGGALRQLEPRLKGALIAACKRDAWTAEAIDCAGNASRTARDRCPGKLSPAQLRSAENAIVAEAIRAIAEPIAAAAPPSARSGPHPDFPTAALAGTDKLFTMIDPERGPKAPIGMAIPRGGLQWTTHATCDLDLTGPVCTPATDDVAGHFRWRVGRRGKELIVVEARRGARVDRTVAYVRSPDGVPLQLVRFDAYDRVESALLFKAPDRYSGRKRNGANALDGCGFISYKLDGSGRAEEQACLQWQGDPMLDTDGVAKLRVVRDASGFITEETRFDLAGKPAANANGVHATLYERDDLARVKLERYRGIDGKPVQATSGCFGYRIDRDDQGAIVQRTCLDAADQPAAQPSTGTSGEAYRVDANGCRIGVRFLSAAGAPSTDHDLVHAMDYEVDERCQITARTCKDKGGKPKVCSGGAPVRYVTKYDAAGNPISVKHYAPYGAPGRDPAFHAFELRRTFDRLGNQLSQSCHDAAGVGVPCPNTDFHVMRSVYDDAGRETQQRYFDEAGRPTSNYGAYKRTYKHDNYDHLVESQNHDEQGALTESFGVAIRKDLFDTAHRRFGLVLYDRNGQPASNSGCYTGGTCPDSPWHAVRILRRKDGSVEKNLFFDTQKKLIDTKFCSASPCFD